MASIQSIYTRELRQRFGYLAAWLPNAKLSLGDVGYLRDHAFERVTSLAELGIAHGVDEPSAPVDLEYISAGGGGLKLEGGGGKAVGVPVRLVLAFKRANAVVFCGRGCRTTALTNLHALGQTIVARHREKTWDRDHVVVTELIAADSITALISDSDSSSIEFEAAVDEVAASLLQLADTSAALKLVKSSGIATKIVGGQATTPLFLASGLTQRLLGGPAFRKRGEGSTAAGPEERLVFADVGYDEEP